MEEQVALSNMNKPTRPACVGGVSKTELLAQLHAAQVRLNPMALALFADDRFTTMASASTLEIAFATVEQLGLGTGAPFGRVVERAAAAGLSLCPLELGPHLRLQFTDQVEGSMGQPASQHCAPAGAVTIASAPLCDDDETPKGFYLRRIGGALWLRGYRSWSGHVWSPADVFVFAFDAKR